MSYTVLIVDDEPLTRVFLIDAIRRGFPVFAKVQQARNGIEALEILQNRFVSHFDCVR